MKSRCGLLAILYFLAAAFAWAQVSYQKIVDAGSQPGHWLTYSGNYQAHRFSPLTQITPENVARLKPAWVYQTPDGGLQTSPLVVDGVMYVTEPPAKVTALDVR